MVADVRGLETGLLGLEGFRLAGKDGEVLVAVEATAVRAWRESCGGRAVSKGRRETRVKVSAFGRAAGGAGVAETPVAVPGSRLRGEVLDGGQSGGAGSVGAVGADPPEAVRQAGQDGIPAAAAARN